jgi:hypothetical protein
MLNWCLEHPWMTFFIIVILINSIDNIVKYITKYHSNEDDDTKVKVSIGK